MTAKRAEDMYAVLCAITSNFPQEPNKAAIAEALALVRKIDLETECPRKEFPYFWVSLAVASVANVVALCVK